MKTPKTMKKPAPLPERTPENLAAIGRSARALRTAARKFQARKKKEGR
jgi:hypothetical protein